MKYYFLFLCILVSIQFFFTQSIQFNFTKNNYDSHFKLHELEIKNTTNSIKEFSITHYQIFTNQTIQALTGVPITTNTEVKVFEGSYSLIDKDPSAFYSMNEGTSQLLLGIGLFEVGTYYFKVVVKYNDGQLEYFTVN